MTILLYALAEVVTAVLIFVAISLFNGWRQASRAANPFTVPAPKVVPDHPKFPEINLRPGGVTEYNLADCPKGISFGEWTKMDYEQWKENDLIRNPKAGRKGQ